MKKLILAAALVATTAGCQSTPDITVRKSMMAGKKEITALYDSSTGEFYKFEDRLVNTMDFTHLHQRTVEELQPIVDKGICDEMTESIQLLMAWGARVHCYDRDGSMYASFRDTYDSAYVDISGNVRYGRAPLARFSTEDMLEIAKIKKQLKSSNFYD
ncbi:hypothetical protein NTE28_003581 [Vibrio harveyi]|nr:hypothetical protein [Vibrio harveyi]